MPQGFGMECTVDTRRRILSTFSASQYKHGFIHILSEEKLRWGHFSLANNAHSHTFCCSSHVIASFCTHGCEDQIHQSNCHITHVLTSNDLNTMAYLFCLHETTFENNATIFLCFVGSRHMAGGTVGATFPLHLNTVPCMFASRGVIGYLYHCSSKVSICLHFVCCFLHK